MRISSVELRSGWLAALVAIITISAGTSLTQAQSTSGNTTRAGSEWPAPGIPADGTVWDVVDATAWAVQPPPDDGAPPAPSERASNCCPLGGWTQSLGFNPVWTGNVFSTNQPRILKEIQLEAGFNGPLAITFGIYGEKPNAPIGDYRALCIQKVTLTGNGRGFYSSGPLNGGAGVTLTPKEVNGSPVSTFFAVAVGWSNASIDFRIDDESYSPGIGFCGGTVRGFWARLGTNPPPAACPSTHELIGLQFYDDGAISMKLCFQEPGGACCLGDRSCVDDVTSNACEQELGGEFLGLYSLCALDADSNCGGFGACCPDGGGECVITTQAACEDAQGQYNGVYKGDGSECSAGGANACDQVLGACCRYDGACEEINEYDCEQSPLNDTPGIYEGDLVECLLPGGGGADRCDALGACCNVSNPSICSDVPEAGCVEFDCVNALNTNGGVVTCPAGYSPDASDEVCPQAGDQCIKHVRTFNLGQPCSQNACLGEVGACCVLGDCEVTNRLECDSLGGNFSTNGLNGDNWDACNVIYPAGCPAPTAGACCLPNGNCKLLSESECIDTNGAYQGDGIGCSAFLCSAGACCFDDMGSPGCIETQPLACANDLNGEFHGSGSTCPSNCSVTGACCMPGGFCQLITPQQCALTGGDYKGDDSICETADCPVPGACCVNIGAFLCFEETDQQCMARPQATKLFTPYGDCDNGCGSGACCELDGTCTVTSGPECTLVDESEFSDGDTCSPSPCTPRGACCTSSGCVTASQADCIDTNGLNGVYRGDGVSCSTANICDIAACCTGSTCADTFITDCASGIHGDPGELCQAGTCSAGACCVDFGTGTLSCQNNFRLFSCRDLADQPGISYSHFAGAGTTCASSPCANLPGACCQLDGSCDDLSPSACSAIAGATFQFGDCASVVCPDRCGAGIDSDFNSNGHVDLKDFAAFQRCMGSSSAACLCAFDANTNGVVDLGDVPAFLAAAMGPVALMECAPFGNSASCDFDEDGWVSLKDFAVLETCFALSTPDECRCVFDTNYNAVVDYADVLAWTELAELHP